MPAVAFAFAVTVSAVVLFAPRSGSGWDVPHLDKVVHVAVFALLAGTAAWLFGRLRAVLAGCVVYAVGSEVVQHVLLPRRSGDAADVVADCAGAGAALLLARAVRRRRARRG
ncbi:VanZ like protein [Kineococcus xinjiangensis]|uniref:VanZ like protein n=1 Tax=Kineococcus xinjiangensis TaxID=512762 RepID=A0A2S6IT25_9ACTN|nr:VanZ like protein [Kineococcus xinjiangensis]